MRYETALDWNACSPCEPRSRDYHGSLQTKAYARLHLRRAKNDAIDAALIAACTAALDPPRREPDARLDALADQLPFVEQTEEDAARLKTRLEHIQDKRLRRSGKALRWGAGRRRLWASICAQREE